MVYVCVAKGVEKMAKRRPSGDGMVRMKKKGQWEGRIVVGHNDDRTPIFHYVYAKSQKELLDKLHLKSSEFMDVDLTQDSQMTLGAWLDKWINEYKVGTIRESTIRGYRTTIERIKEYLGHKKIYLVTTSDVQKMYNKMKKDGRKQYSYKYGTELSATTIIRTHLVLHQAMDVAVRECLISKNPTNNTTLPKKEKEEMQVLNEEELERFTKEFEKDEDWRDFFYTEITTGLRQGEICGLKWSDYNEYSGTLTINRSIKVYKGEVIEGETKTGNGKRTFYLPPSTMNVLNERRWNAQSEWIFWNPIKPEIPVSPQSAYSIMKKILKKADLPSIRFHDLRHTFATHALASGVDAKTLSVILGHANASFTLDTYAHITTDMQKRASEIVGGFMQDIFGEELSS